GVVRQPLIPPRPGQVARRLGSAPPGDTLDLVVHGGAAPPRDFESGPDLDAFDRLDRHERLGQATVQATVPRDVASEADRYAASDDLDNPAQSVAIAPGRVDRLDHALLRLPVQGADRRIVDGGVQVRGE